MSINCRVFTFHILTRLHPVSIFFLVLVLLVQTLSLPATAHDTSQEGFPVITLEEEERTINPVAISRASREVLVLEEIPASYTGTEASEWIEYQLPSNYNPTGPAHALLVAWHGYGQTCQSVSISSRLDEECEERNWIFLAITGVHQCNFGFLKAQIHCSKAIQYMIEEKGFNINTSRIYMAGFSMGGGGALSYTCRHMSHGEGYPVAGLILVIPASDWTYMYNQGDPGSTFWLPLLLGGTPAQEPFAYKQISTLYIEENCYILDESMGQNLRHGLPVFLTYAGNDPIPDMVYQNRVLAEMLVDLDANFIEDYKPFDPNPHSWTLLNEDLAFDFIGIHLLENQQTESVTLLADRDAKFYWADVVQQTLGDTFSKVVGEVDADKNEVIIHEAANMDMLRVDCEWTGLGHDQRLMIEYSSSSSVEQELQLEPIAIEPTYIVDDQGVLHPDYSYSSEDDRILIQCPFSSALDLKVSFESYNLTLTSDETVPIGGTLTSTLGNGDPFDPFLMFFALTQIETKVGMHHLLVDPFFPTLWILSNLNGEGAFYFHISIPNDPGWVGLVIYQQFLTYNPFIKEISNLVNTTFVDPG